MFISSEFHRVGSLITSETAELVNRLEGINVRYLLMLKSVFLYTRNVFVLRYIIRFKCCNDGNRWWKWKKLHRLIWQTGAEKN